MNKRCYQVNSPTFRNHGGRGITVCVRWRNSFENFLTDMGECSEGLTLERQNNNGNYEPDNCVWDTPAAQARNRRNTRMITYNSETMCLKDWADRFDTYPTTLARRLEHSSVRQVFDQPRIYKRRIKL
jgi:hypothetical protein